MGAAKLGRQEETVKGNLHGLPYLRLQPPSPCAPRDRPPRVQAPPPRGGAGYGLRSSFGGAAAEPPGRGGPDEGFAQAQVVPRGVSSGGAAGAREAAGGARAVDVRDWHPRAE